MERAVGYWPVKDQDGDSCVCYWDGTVWRDVEGGLPFAIRDFKPIGPRLISPSEVAEVVGKLREMFNADRGFNITNAKEQLDRLSPQLEIKAGKWMVDREGMFCLPISERSWNFTGVLVDLRSTVPNLHIKNWHKDGRDYAVDGKESHYDLVRRATPAEVTELRKIVPIGE